MWLLWLILSGEGGARTRRQVSQDNASHAYVGLKRTTFSKPPSKMKFFFNPQKGEKRTWKYFLKHLPDDATPLVMGLQRKSCFVHGSLAGPAWWGWQQGLVIGGRCAWTRLGQSRACSDKCAQASDHNTILRKLLMNGGNGRRKASRSLFRFVPTGMFVYLNVYLYECEHLCVRIQTQSNFWFSVVCLPVNGCFHSALGCGVT